MKFFLLPKHLFFCFMLLVIASCKDEMVEPLTEDSENTIDTIRISLEYPNNYWKLASTPNTGAFDKSDAINDWEYNYDRARTALYWIDFPNIYSESFGPMTHYNRRIFVTEVFPHLKSELSELGIELRGLRTMDLAYFPSERGPYNFNIEDLDSEGYLTNLQTRWGGFQRALTPTNLESNNIKFIEFWLLDPFLENTSNQGSFYINLGSVSEDILKDGRLSFESGLPIPGQSENTDTTTWGRVSNNNATSYYFDIDTLNRKLQDIGLDGLDNEGESVVFQDYLDEIQTTRPDIVANNNGQTFASILADPANDDFRFYINANWPEGTDIIDRYRYFNNPEGNSSTVDAPYVPTNLPDSEDLDRNNVVEQVESFFEYKIHLEPDMQVGENFITDIRIDNSENTSVTNPVTGAWIPARWYKFQIPISDYDEAFGGISDFTSTKFIRLYLTDFAEPVVLRLAEFNLIRIE